LGKEWHAAFLRGRPAPLHRVIVLPNYRGVSQPDTWAEESDEDRAAQDLFFTEMQEEQFDLALQMHGGGGNSNPFLLRLGAHVTANWNWRRWLARSPRQLNRTSPLRKPIFMNLAGPSPKKSNPWLCFIQAHPIHGGAGRRDLLPRLAINWRRAAFRWW
jgi:hypothetical protein